MHLHDLMDRDDLAAMEDQGYIDVRPHQTLPFAIINYTKQCAWERKWNEVTTKCRGLIYDYFTMEIIARPFDKFFNYEELGPEWVMPGGSVEITDKMDGSLGILYPRGDGTYAVATRGSFTSDQALHATEVLRTRYADWKPMPGITYLFEIIYPENRIVLNYGDMDDLVFLGGRDIETGMDFGPYGEAVGWPGPCAKVFPGINLAYALQMAPRENAEGVVVAFADGTRVKLKQQDYVELHRIVTGMTDRVIWEELGAGKLREDIKRPLPEEFHPWVDQVHAELTIQMAETLLSVWEEYDSVVASLPSGWTRKDFALAVKDSPNRAYLFMYLDGRSIWDVVWKSIKPPAGRSMAPKTWEDDE